MKVFQTIWTGLLGFVLGIPGTWAQNIPKFTGERVLDVAGLLRPDTKAYLNDILKAHEDSTSNQVMVLVVKSLEGYDVETYATKAFRTYQLGQKDKNNGVLILIAVDDRTVRIETGYGLEGALPDALCGRIIEHEMVPYFREGNYDGGVIMGVHAVLRAIAGEYEANPREKSLPISPWFIAIALIVVGALLLLLSDKAMGGTTRGGGWWLPYGGFRYFGGGSFWGSGGGGGFFGGGGSSGGGGASGRW